MTYDLSGIEQHAFAALPTRSLADVRDICAATLSGTAARDTASAFRFLEDRLGVDLAATLARPQEVRELFTAASAAALGVSIGRLANVRSRVSGAVKEHAMRRVPLTEAIELNPAWAALLGKVEVRESRWSLHRFATWCTVTGIDPAAVSAEMLPDFQAALEADGTLKKPKSIRKSTIAAWNHCARRVPGWPDIQLAWPKAEPYMLPLTAFPAGFQRAVADWTAGAACDDPFAENARVQRPLRPATIQAHITNFRRLASALVREGGVPIERIDGFGILFEGENYKNALRPFHGKSEGYVYRMATLLRAVMAEQPEVDEATRTAVNVLVNRLAPRGGQQMGKRNSERLKQFSDDDVVRRLLAFPEAECARASGLRSPFRRAKAIERALATSIALHTGLRAKNLRSLHLKRNIRRIGDRVRIELADTETKTHRTLTLELPAATVHLLDLFLAEHRAALPGAVGAYLFPGEDGGPRSYSALRTLLKDRLFRATGIELSPHLFRHIIALIVAERAPENLPAVSRMFGHASLNRTYQSYLGTEGPTASRTIARLLGEMRAGSGDAGELHRATPGRKKPQIRRAGGQA